MCHIAISQLHTSTSNIDILHQTMLHIPDWFVHLPQGTPTLTSSLQDNFAACDYIIIQVNKISSDDYYINAIPLWPRKDSHSYSLSFGNVNVIDDELNRHFKIYSKRWLAIN